MLRRALKLRAKINVYIAKTDDPLDTISMEEWGTLHTLHGLLEPFWILTLRLQGQATNGHGGAVWEVLPATKVLMDHLERARGNHLARKSKNILVCIDNALTKLREYFYLLDASPVYAVSLVLNPAIKVCFFNEN
jgi:hypothetical protein